MIKEVSQRLEEDGRLRFPKAEDILSSEMGGRVRRQLEAQEHFGARPVV